MSITGQNLDSAARSQANLAANKLGVISEQQRQEIQALVSLNWPRLIFLLDLILIICFLVPILFLSQNFLIVISIGLLVLGVILAMGLIGLVMKSVFSNRGLIKDLKAGKVEQAVGRSVAQGDHYVIESDVEAVRRLGTMNLPVGEYQFYYLPNSGRPLCIVALSPLSSQAVITAAFNTLTLATGFTTDDIAVNRKGKLAPNQRPILLQLWMGRIGLIIVLLFMAIGTLLPLNGRPIEFTWSWGVSVLGILAFIFCTGLLVAVGLFHQIYDIFIGRVASAEAVMSLDNYQPRSSSSTECFFVLGKERFVVPRRTYKALTAGLAYRFYFGPTSKIFISIEPLKFQE